MSSREYSSSSSSSPSTPEVIRSGAEKRRSPIKGSKPDDSLWKLAGRSRRRSQRISPEEETPVTTPTVNFASEVDFPSLPAVVKRR